MGNIMAEETKSRLGRGLSALLGDDGGQPAAETARNAVEVPIESLMPNPYQPRRHFDEDAIAELVESIRSRGVLQPLLVRRSPTHPGRYEIIAGERRWRASQRARLHQVPIVVRDFTDKEALEVAIIENIQRQDLTPIEEARAYQRLVDEFQHTQEALGEVVGKSRSHVANLMRLLQLPPAVQKMLGSGEISMGHARALVTATDPETLAREIVRRNLTVRQAENFAAGAGRRRAAAAKSSAARKDADTLALEQDLSEALGLAVALDHKGEEGGAVTIRYKTLDQLDEICRRLCNS
jgi:ParB family chromosome partitioning protein